MEILEELGCKVLYGPEITPAPEGTSPERKSYSDVFLVGRLARAIDKLNPGTPREAREEALKKVLRVESQKLIVNNPSFHKMLVNGVDMEYRKKKGRIAGDKVWFFDFKNPENNEFLAVSQFTVIDDSERGYERS